MVRNNSIEHKKKKPKLESLAKESDESTLTQKSKEFAKHAEISIGHPLHSAKATSFSPLSSTDTSVHADSPILTATHLGSQKVCHSKNEKEMLQTCVIEKRGEFKDEIKNDKKTNLDTDESCNVKTCPMEVYSREICGTHLNTSIKHDSEDKISPMISPIKLTEMINTSIKEAMKTIVKQCRMGEERDLDKKSEKDLVESVSRVNKEAIPTKVKQPRVTRKQFNNHSGISKPGTNLEKSHEGAAKRYGKRGNASEKIKKKYSKSPNNVKTDNRKMTGNVNIYICSEATENTQAASKQEKSETCTESSSTTTTEESKISSSKLLASIRNKRRKFEERDSFDLPEREESNNSIAYSNLSKYMDSKSAIKSESSNFIDIRNNLDNDVRIKNIESTSTECKCKDTNISDTIVTIDKSDLSFEKSKFVICDALEKPFDFGRTKTIYPVKSSSLSESEEWSSKSACSSRNLDCVLSNTWSLEPNLNRIAESEKRRVSLKTLESVCKCLKKDQELIDRYNLRCNCRNKKYSIKTVEKEPLICNCITEEEEDDVCVNVATSREFEKSAEAGKQQITTCRKISADVKESAMLVPSTEHSTDLHSSPKLNEKDTKTLEQDKNEEKLKIDKTEISDEDKSSEKKKAEQFHGTQEMDQRPKETRHNIPKFVAFPKLVRPEVITLKHLLQLRNPEKAIEHKDVSPTSVKPSNSLEQSVQDTKLKVRSQVSPKILRKFNLPKESTFPEQPTVEEKQPSSEAKGKEVLDEKSSKEKLAEKALESKNDTKNQTARNLQGKLRGSFLFKSFKKITGKAEHSETKTDEFMKKDNKIAERISSDADTDKNLQIPKTEAEKLPVKPKIEIKETYKQNGKFIPSKMYSHIPKINESKPESDTVNLTKSPTNEGNKKDKKNDSIVSPSKSIGKEVEQEAKDETISDDSEKKQTKSKSLINIDSKTPPVSSTKGIDSELSKQENTEKDEKLDESRKIVKNREFHESLKKPQFEKKSDIEGKRKSALQITKTRRETPVKIAYDTHCEQASIAVDTYSSKLISSSHTVCSNSNYAKCASANDCISMEKNTCNYCNCCYLPILQCDNEHINYPKSCLKMERQCCHTVSQENNRPILYHDKRNWEECGCRRIISCNTCCKARNDCR
ncbi:PREDICTED: uncharacterized protein LOC108555401 [Eufriesea mexicana]|uniref:uncharacterized protein LOC108555401 n=1 Tax=Eufriesea mexicana TaxID=516756 RepID=UPI00083C3C08|nr:PREDICTED: uncharacterized protein LOC108555401 [Eufriesea mexicana]